MCLEQQMIRRDKINPRVNASILEPRQLKISINVLKSVLKPLMKLRKYKGMQILNKSLWM